MTTETPQQKKAEPPKFLGKPYIIHEIECICENPHFRMLAHAAPDYKFEAFHLLDELGQPVKSHFACDNCGTVWKCEELGKAEMSDMTIKPIYTKDDINRKLPQDLKGLLDEINVPLSKRAWAVWVLQNSAWGEKIVIGARNDRAGKDNVIYKMLEIRGYGSYRIKDLTASMGIVEF